MCSLIFFPCPSPNACRYGRGREISGRLRRGLGKWRRKEREERRRRKGRRGEIREVEKENLAGEKERVGNNGAGNYAGMYVCTQPISLLRSPRPIGDNNEEQQQKLHSSLLPSASPPLSAKNPKQHMIACPYEERGQKRCGGGRKERQKRRRAPF